MLKKLILFFGFCVCILAANAQQPLTNEDVKMVIDCARLLKGGKSADTVAIRKEITEFVKNKTERELVLASKLASVIKQPAMADSINAVSVATYPNGWVAFLKGYSEIMLVVNDPVKKAALYEVWIHKFPEPEGKSDSHYENVRADIAGAFAQVRDISNNAYWINAIKGANFRLFVKESNSGIFMQRGDTTTAETMLRSALTEVKDRLVNAADTNARAINNSLLGNLARLLYHEHKYKEALAPIDEAYERSPQKTMQLKETYAFILTENGRGKEALPLLSDLAKNGKMGPDNIKELRSAYIQSKGGIKGFDEFMASLTSIMKANVQAKLNQKMLSLAAPEFSLVDLSGNRVSLRDYKGKVVVLDFWATWCGPCKKSFPAMQMTLNKYKDDSNVKFLFIDTWERMPDPTDAIKSLIAQNKYDFKVLLDNQSTGIVDKYGIKSIPAKFIIDGSGTIRFKLTGFEGSNEAAVEELSLMIEAARKAG